MENVELIRRCQMGDKNSFADLYALYRKKAYGTAFLIANHKGIAEDIVQEAFIECFKKLNVLRNAESFEVWFYKVLVRTGWRMVKRHDLYTPIDDQTMEKFSATNSANSDIEASETNIVLCEAVEKLSLPLRTVVVLHYFNDLSIEEIANVLGCFQGTVKSRLYNARKQLHELLTASDLQARHIFVCE